VVASQNLRAFFCLVFIYGANNIFKELAIRGNKWSKKEWKGMNVVATNQESSQNIRTNFVSVVLYSFGALITPTKTPSLTLTPIFISFGAQTTPTRSFG